MSKKGDGKNKVSSHRTREYSSVEDYRTGRQLSKIDRAILKRQIDDLNWFLSRRRTRQIRAAIIAQRRVDSNNGTVRLTELRGTL